MNKFKRVDIKLEDEILRAAAIEAAKQGISRREFLSNCVRTIVRWNTVKEDVKYCNRSLNIEEK